MVYRPKIDPKLAFVLMPFRAPFDSYYNEIIRPAARLAGLDARRADEIYGTGPIIQDIWNQIWAASVVIADVTSKNPNVNYELGICHTLGIPTVIITQDFDDVPFDYRHRRCIRYDREDVNWQRKLKTSITATLKEVIQGENAYPELGWPYDTSPAALREQIGTLLPAVDARDVVIRGSRRVRDAVAHAFGPHGSHISVRAAQDQTKYYKEGAAVASSLHSPERLEEIGIRHASRLAQEMRDSVGDGSKNAVLLFHGMLEHGSSAIRRNHPVHEVVRGMERATEVLISAVRSQGIPASQNLLTQVARTAACGNHKIADLVVKAYADAGPDGVIVIEPSDLRETTLELQEGISFDGGYVSDALISPTEVRECILDNPYVLPL